ncbi:MAG: hypothetical protein NZ765_07490 [Anaerolineae bacterium]|nr:hypothetical protein [Anaerolineae bacterium]
MKHRQAVALAILALEAQAEQWADPEVAQELREAAKTLERWLAQTRPPDRRERPPALRSNFSTLSGWGDEF